jgi:Fic-DOC domain mobile mystery protein B
MAIMKITHAPGATPLDPDEAAGLIPAHIATQNDLNMWEEANILQAEQWMGRVVRLKKRTLLDEGFVRDLHHQMFNQTWRWSGTFRKSNKNIGVEWSQVATKLRNLLDNTQYQIGYAVASPDEIAIRMHHQMVWIHPFPNGNGRHSRLMADALAMYLGRPRFSWGAQSLVNESRTRDAYLQALRLADTGDLSALMVFARS